MIVQEKYHLSFENNPVASVLILYCPIILLAFPFLSLFLNYMVYWEQGGG